MKISIVGYGTFGKALASHLSRLHHEIQIDDVKNSEIIFVSTPSWAVFPALKKLKDDIIDQKIVICSKGFAENGKLISDVLKEEFAEKNIFFLYGPTIAAELENNILSGIVLAGGEGKEEIKKNIESENLKVELTTDVIGVQVGASMKNVVTIFIGIAEGAGYGQNTQAFVLTRGLKETQSLGVALGAEPCTFIGLTCLGDLTLRSRNRLIGVELGKGRNLEEVSNEIKHAQEGINTIKNCKIISENIGLKLPFVDTLHSIIFEKLSIDEGIRKILD